MARHQHVLVAQRKLADFIRPPTHDGVLEASGVIAKGADYYVIFDNVRRIARIHRGLEPGSKRHGWFGRKRDGEGYAVLSQQSSLLWIGTLRFGDWTVADEGGTTYQFPRTKKGKIKYGTVEGLCWLTDRSFVCVSDFARRPCRKRFRKMDQSIHVFKLPRRRAGTGHRHRSEP